MSSDRTRLPSWRKLTEHQRANSRLHLRQLLERDPDRFKKFSLSTNGILLDFSKQLVTAETMRLLLALARECKLDSWRARMLRGERINVTENRAALHVALRANARMRFEGRNITRDVAAMLKQMGRFVRAIRSGRIKCGTGREFTDIVNIGIGGSDLGPRLACEALKPYCKPRLRLHFVSNVDGAALSSVMDEVNPTGALVIVTSKTFTTEETLVNARTAKAWLVKELYGKTSARKRHLCAVTAEPARALEFGVPEKRVFRLWDWVGGRYSLWSAVGLPVALAIGMERFEEMRAGARAMDEHFAFAPPERNLPVILGLLEVWNASFRGCGTRAVLPYDQRLRLLPAYLQQLEMESSGKTATRDGSRVRYATAPVTWGSAGTDGQHAYFQWLHQGTAATPADFIACCRPHHALRGHHEVLFANFLAQTEALAHGMGKHEAAAAMRKQGLPDSEIGNLLPHRVFEGNRPTTSILLEELTPRAFGALLALYEHKVFVQSVIWDINPFDQWGVELGKSLARRILPELEGSAPVATHDASTDGLINHYKANR